MSKEYTHKFARAKAVLPGKQKGRAMHEVEARLKYPFGEITIKMGVEGNVDRPEQVVTHMLSTATAVTGIEIVQRGLSDSQRSESSLQQECATSVKFGEIKVTAEINFDLKRQVPKRTLNSMVFGGILPKVSQTAEIYFGDNQSLTTPQEPLAQRPRRDVLDYIDEALELNGTTPSRLLASEPYGYGPQPHEQRQRQPAFR